MAFPKAPVGQSEKRAPLFSRKGPSPALVLSIGGAGSPKKPEAPAADPVAGPVGPDLAGLEARLAKLEGWCKGMGMDADGGAEGGADGEEAMEEAGEATEPEEMT